MPLAQGGQVGGTWSIIKWDLSSLCEGSSHCFQCWISLKLSQGLLGQYACFPGAFSSAWLKVGLATLLATIVLLAPPKNLCQISLSFPPPFSCSPSPNSLLLFQGTLAGKPISMSPCGEVTGSPSPHLEASVRTKPIGPGSPDPGELLPSLTHASGSSGCGLVHRSWEDNQRLATHTTCNHPLPCCLSLSQRLPGSSRPGL